MTKPVNILYWHDPIPPKVVEELVKMAKENNIGEPYDTNCDMVYTWVEEGKIVGAVAFQKVLFSDGQIIPRIEHIIFDKDHDSHKAARSSFVFLLKVEQLIMEYGFTQMWAYVDRTRHYMYELAIKFGFKEYNHDEQGNYMIKNLNLKKRRF